MREVWTEVVLFAYLKAEVKDKEMTMLKTTLLEM